MSATDKIGKWESADRSGLLSKLAKHPMLADAFSQPGTELQNISQSLLVLKSAKGVLHAYVDLDAKSLFLVKPAMEHPAFTESLEVAGYRIVAKWPSFAFIPLHEAVGPHGATEIVADSRESLKILGDASFFNDRFFIEAMLSDTPPILEIHSSAMAAFLASGSANAKDLLRLKNKGRIPQKTFDESKSMAGKNVVKNVLDPRFALFDARTVTKGSITSLDVENLFNAGIIGRMERSNVRKALDKAEEYDKAFDEIMGVSVKNNQNLRRETTK